MSVVRSAVSNIAALCLISIALQACSDVGDTLPTPAEVSYDTPAELLEEMRRLQSRSCSLDCQLAIADMYSAEYLQSIRDALMFGLSDEATRGEVSSMLFGEELSVGDFDAMTDQEFFARQLLHRERTTPREMLMLDYEILNEERVSDSRVEIVVMRSGLPDFPDYKEEDLMAFVREDGVWKITF